MTGMGDIGTETDHGIIENPEEFPAMPEPVREPAREPVPVPESVPA